jgi:hypothetical protein
VAANQPPFLARADATQTSDREAVVRQPALRRPRRCYATGLASPFGALVDCDQWLDSGDLGKQIRIVQQAQPELLKRFAQLSSPLPGGFMLDRTRTLATMWARLLLYGNRAA